MNKGKTVIINRAVNKKDILEYLTDIYNNIVKDNLKVVSLNIENIDVDILQVLLVMELDY